ncbi:MAG TPA: hypothetical protein VEG38_08885 [Acidimicrobiia bacterium]|nr:hypothetical protein [Acidimicrobiia bacterium]
MATYTERFNLRKPTASDHVNVALDIAGNMDLLDAHTHSGTYVPSDPTLAITYNPDGTVASVAETHGGSTITTTFTYNADGTIATSTRLGVTRTYTYSSGNLTVVA